MDVKEHVARNESAANEVLAAMRLEKDPEEFYALLKRYIQLRYLLEDDAFWEDDLAALTKYSIKKTLERSGDPAKLRDLGVNCAGASSAVTKQLLLVISLRKGLGVDLDPDAVACAETVHALADLLRSALGKER